MVKTLFLFVILSAMFVTVNGKGVATKDKQRLIVMTDLGGTDPDDTQSMIHLLLCSDRVDIEGIISTCAWVDAPDQTSKIKQIVDSFGKLRPRLLRHSGGFPSAGHLKKIVVAGQPHANMEGVGEGKDSEGAKLIIKAVDDRTDSRPIWITAWGGMNTLAQALWTVRQTRSEVEVKRFVGKIRVYDVLGQDDAGAWIAKTFPEVVYIRNSKIYGWAPSDEWTRANIQNIGPLGRLYPNRIWATEGDSPAFLYLIANGLNAPEHIDYGGWGGRFSTIKTAGIRGMDFIVKSGKDETQYDSYLMSGNTDEGVGAINMWRNHIYNDFAARMQWTVADNYSDANHHPTAIIGKDKSLACIYRTVNAGDTIHLDASKSFDPDGDNLHFHWIVYKEPSTYKGVVAINHSNSSTCDIAVPADSYGKSFHVILVVSDDGTPSLTAYRRIVFTVKNKI